MDVGQQGHGPEDEADAHQEDGAERAFDALREEVAALRRGVELVYRQAQQAGQQSAAAGPDYTLTLGKMEKALGVIAGRLEAVERQPAMQMTGASLRAELDTAAQDAASTMIGSLAGAANELRSATMQMEGMFRQVRGQREQQAWLWTTGGCGVLGGVLLWFMLAALLPWGAGDWLTSLPIGGGGPWASGAALMDRASPQSWDKMVRLYKACGTQATELCEAAITVRTMPPLTQEETKAPPAMPPGRPLPRSRTGQQAQ